MSQLPIDQAARERYIQWLNSQEGEQGVPSFFDDPTPEYDAQTVREVERSNVEAEKQRVQEMGSPIDALPYEVQGVAQGVVDAGASLACRS